jgi:hypothetical protein
VKSLGAPPSNRKRRIRRRTWVPPGTLRDLAVLLQGRVFHQRSRTLMYAYVLAAEVKVWLPRAQRPLVELQLYDFPAPSSPEDLGRQVRGEVTSHRKTVRALLEGDGRAWKAADLAAVVLTLLRTLSPRAAVLELLQTLPGAIADIPDDGELQYLLDPDDCYPTPRPEVRVPASPPILARAEAHGGVTLLDPQGGGTESIPAPVTREAVTQALSSLLSRRRE